MSMSHTKNSQSSFKIERIAAGMVFVVIAAAWASGCAGPGPGSSPEIIKRDRFGEGGIGDMGSMKSASQLDYEKEQAIDFERKSYERRAKAINADIHHSEDELSRLQNERRIIESYKPSLDAIGNPLK